MQQTQQSGRQIVSRGEHAKRAAIKYGTQETILMRPAQAQEDLEDQLLRASVGEQL